jgi:hypothetical protein
MSENGPEGESFEETLRAIAEELGRKLESSIDNFDSDKIAESFGVDPTVAREWVDNTSGWLRGFADNIGGEVARRVGEQAAREQNAREQGAREQGAHERGRVAAEAELFGGATPHPLDLPTDDQALALAALDSGRWTVEPGTDALAARGDGPGPSDALGIVRELRVRDWIAADGELTLVGRDALSRWLEARARASKRSDR